MNEIISIEQYKKLIYEAKADGCRLSNCFFLLEEVKQMISEKTLSFLKLNHGLLLLEDANCFYRCYYYFSEDKKPDGLVLKKDAVVEFPFNEKVTDSEAMQIRIINQMGFKLGRESAMMKALTTSLEIERTDDSLCDIASDEDTEQVYNLLKNNFDPLYAFLPTISELKNAIEEGYVFVIKQDKQIIGALISNKVKKVATINQIIVDPDYRRKGCGAQLVDFYHRFFVSDVLSFQHWVDLKNESAINMYKKLGYEFTCRRANEYILKV